MCGSQSWPTAPYRAGQIPPTFRNYITNLNELFSPSIGKGWVRHASIRAVDGRRADTIGAQPVAWTTFMERYDRPFTLFYIDPPYWGHETD